MLGAPNIDRQARRREETRREILDAAWAMVREHGWSGLTQRGVAEQVGMRAPSLYTHFASKLDIIDAMFGQAWAEYDTAVSELLEPALPDDGREALPDDRREALIAAAEHWLQTMTADPERHALMNQRPIPGFTPSPDAYAPAVRTLERLRAFLVRIGITDPDAVDLWTALVAGLASQQIANDPSGARWSRLVPRAVDMYLSQVAPPAPSVTRPRGERTRKKQTTTPRRSTPR